MLIKILNQNNQSLLSTSSPAKIDGKPFSGGEGKNTQLILGKDLFIKGFDKQLIGVKKDEEKFNVTLPENYPQKEFANKKAKFKFNKNSKKIRGK